MSESRKAWWRDGASTAASSRSLVESMEQMRANPVRRTLPTMLYMSASCAEALHAMSEEDIDADDDMFSPEEDREP